MIEQDLDWQALQRKVAFLKKPDAYPQQCLAVEAIETHMSWVFLTEDYAYKLKKPMKLSYLDLSLEEKRLQNARKEVEINQFLAPGIYLSVIPLRQNNENEFYPLETKETGPVVDWLVKMRRFPREKTLDHLISKNTINQKILLKTAEFLNQFYHQAKPFVLEAKQYETRLRDDLEHDFKCLCLPRYALNQALIFEIYQKQQNTLSLLQPEINHRVEEQKIIDCHGDLRPEHICLTDPPIIIDRLEFNALFRMMDPVDELAYLALECEYLERPDIGNLFLQSYKKTLNDYFSDLLVRFYKTNRAFLRAKIAIWHLDDQRITEKDKWHKKAQHYLELARGLY